MPDDDELNYAIHQERLYGQTAEPLTVRAIIQRIGKIWRSSTAKLSAAEGAFLADFAAAGDRGAHIEDSFLPAALDNGTTLETYTTFDDDADKEREDHDAEKEREASGWFALHRFLGMYVVNWTQYGEGQELYGPFAKKKDAEAVLEAAVELNTMPGHSVARG